MQAVDSVLGQPHSLWEGGERAPSDDHLARGGRETRSQRHLLLPVLHSIQDRVGWVSRGGLEYACRRLSVPPAEAYGVVTFYDRFATDKRPPLAVHVCDDVACKCAGADELCAALESAFGPSGPSGSHSGAAWYRSPCLGLCDQAPAVLMERSGMGHVEGRITRAQSAVVREVLDGGEWPQAEAAGIPQPRSELRLLRRAGEIDPESFDSYRAAGGYSAFRRALELGPEGVIRELTDAKLLGRGGAAFPTGRKWGAGAYICGEETALFNSIEGKRGEPRNKPPFPVQAGLFGKPTLVNNVETLMNVLEILNTGAAAYAATGTADSTGTRLFCLSGHVRAPGVYEVPMGTTLRSLIGMAGGLHEGRELQAVLLGGAAGSFVTEKQLDVPLSFEGTRAIGATLGSGAVIVLDDTADLNQILLRIARFFKHESCGQCVPCRVGTQRQEEILQRVLASRGANGREGDIALLGEIAQAMRDASICGLGQTAASAIQSAFVQLGVGR